VIRSETTDYRVENTVKLSIGAKGARPTERITALHAPRRRQSLLHEEGANLIEVVGTLSASAARWFSQSRPGPAACALCLTLDGRHHRMRERKARDTVASLSVEVERAPTQVDSEAAR